MNLDDLGRRAGAELQAEATAGADGLPSAASLTRQSGQRRGARMAAGSFLAVAALAGAVTLAGAGDSSQELAVGGPGADDAGRDRPCGRGVETRATVIIAADADGTVVSFVGDAEAEGRTPCIVAPTTSTTTELPSTIPDRHLPPCDIGSPTTFAFAPGECIPTAPSTSTSIVRPPSTSTSTSIAPPPSPPPGPSTSTTWPSQPPAGPVTLRGRVTAGPVCAVEQVPPASGCADIGIVANITFTPVTPPGAVVPQYFLTATSEADGTYERELSVGRWSITAASSQAMSCPTTVLDVTASTTTFDIRCDTGIR